MIRDDIKFTEVDFSDQYIPVFNLTCTSHGGPATTVAWTRDVRPVSIDANHMLSQRVTNMSHSTYKNVLTVTGCEPGRYQCCVGNARRSRVCSKVFIVEGKAFSSTGIPISCGDVNAFVICLAYFVWKIMLHTYRHAYRSCP